MKFWDLLTGKNNTVDYTKNMPPLLPQFDNIRINDDGSSTKIPDTAPEKPVTAFDKLSNRTKKIGNKLFNNLFGNQAQPTEFIDTDNMSVGISSNPRVGGFLNDFSSGARENFTTGFAAPNLYSKQTADGRNKGFAYRLGEGLGTIGRIAESPLGRGLITAGLVGATGGNSLDALAFGGQAGALNQRLRNQDRMYRNEMIANAQSALKNNPEFNNLSVNEQNAIYNQLLTNSDGTMKNYDTMNDKEKAEFNVALNKAYADKLYQNQQQQLNNVANQINSMRGYVTDDVYNNLVRAQQLRDNADFKKMYFDSNQKNQEAIMQLRKDQLEMQKQQNAMDNYYRGQSNALGWANLSERVNAREAAQKAKQNADEYGDIQAQLDNFAQTFKTVDNPYRYRAFGGVSQALNTLSKDEANFNAQRTLLFNQIARKLGGEKGVLSDKDIERVEAALPKLSDTLQQKQAKMEAVYDLLDIKRGSANQGIYNPLGLDL